MAKGNAGHLPPVSAKTTLQTADNDSDNGLEVKPAPDFDIGDEVEAQWMEPADDGEAQRNWEFRSVESD